MKRQTYLRKFKKRVRNKECSLIFIPDDYFIMCLKILHSSSGFHISIVKESNRNEYYKSLIESTLEFDSFDSCPSVSFFVF